MARQSKLTDKDKQEIRELYSADPVKYTKYRLAIMYHVTWKQIHYAIDEPARLRNIQLTNERNAKKGKN